jgi:hypothetical protein
MTSLFVALAQGDDPAAVLAVVAEFDFDPELPQVRSQAPELAGEVMGLLRPVPRAGRLIARLVVELDQLLTGGSRPLVRAPEGKERPQRRSNRAGVR